jgi:hypothetical protein
VAAQEADGVVGPLADGHPLVGADAGGAPVHRALVHGDDGRAVRGLDSVPGVVAEPDRDGAAGTFGNLPAREAAAVENEDAGQGWCGSGHGASITRHQSSRLMAIGFRSVKSRSQVS